MTSQAVKNVRANFWKGKTIGERVKLGDELGAGSYGVVFEGSQPDGEICAVKILSREGATPFDITAIERETNLLLKLDHPNIIRASQAYLTRDSTSIKMERAEGPVSDLVDRTKEEADLQKLILVIFRGLLDAILYLHNNKIAHRDIKHDNLLYKSGAEGLHIILCDFGMSVNIEADVVWPVLGSPAYKSPELVDGRQSDYIPFAADIWALSITLYVLLTCNPPWDEARKTNAAYQRYLRDHKTIFGPTLNLCTPVEDLILRGLTHDPKLRPDIHTFRAAFMEIKELWKVNESPKRSLAPDVGETDVAKRLRMSGGDDCARCGEASVTGLNYPFKGQWENHWVCERCLQSVKEMSLVTINSSYAYGMVKGDICRYLRQLKVEKSCDASVPAFLIKGPKVKGPSVFVSVSDIKSLIPVLYHGLFDGKPSEAAMNERRTLYKAFISRTRLREGTYTSVTTIPDYDEEQVTTVSFRLRRRAPPCRVWVDYVKCIYTIRKCVAVYDDIPSQVRYCPGKVGGHRHPSDGKETGLQAKSVIR